MYFTVKFERAAINFMIMIITSIWSYCALTDISIVIKRYIIIIKRSIININLIATCVHWKLCRKFEIKVTKNWYEYVLLPHTVTQTRIKILWDVEIKTTTKIKHNWPDIVVIMPGKRKWQLIDIAIPRDYNILSKDNEKVSKYIDLVSVIRAV